MGDAAATKVTREVTPVANERFPIERGIETYSPTGSILSLQRAAGNAAMVELLSSHVLAAGTFVQRTHLSCDEPENMSVPCPPGAEDREKEELEELPSGVQAKLTVSHPGDAYEIEADHIADRIMREADTALPALPARYAAPAQIHRACTSCATGGGTCPKCVEEENAKNVVSRSAMPFLARKAPVDGHSAGVGASKSSPVTLPPRVISSIESAKSQGHALPATVQDFFGSRLPYDFSGVRIHRSSQAVVAARQLRARAFTVGRDIVFGAGEYAPETSAGKRLLAHELVHVVQQTRPSLRESADTEMISGYYGANRAHPKLLAGAGLVQCDKIDHRDLTWEDFKAKAPKKTPFEAATFSDFHPLDLTAFDASAVETEDLAEPCKVGKKELSKFKATLTIDPDDIEVKAFMDQDLSWAKPWTTDDAEREVKCQATFVKQCEAFFAKKHKEIGKKVKSQVKACKKEVKKAAKAGETVKFILGEEELEVATPEECVDPFGPKLEEFMKSTLSFTAKLADAEFEVTKQSECSVELLDECIKTLMQAGSDALLRHEQGHFDITHENAENTQEALRDLAGGFAAEFTACGEDAATKKAKNALAGHGKKLKKVFGTAKTAMRKMHKTYDKQTKHGIVLEKQAEWAEKLAEGF